MKIKFLQNVELPVTYFESRESECLEYDYFNKNEVIEIERYVKHISNRNVSSVDLYFSRNVCAFNVPSNVITECI